MRRPLIAGNWKMYKTVAEAVALAARAARAGARAGDARGGGRPALHGARRRGRGRCAGSGIGLAAQNMHCEKRGRLHGRGLARDAQGRRAAPTSSSATPSAASSSARPTRASPRRREAALRPRPRPHRLRGRDAWPSARPTARMEVVERQIERALRGLSADQVAAHRGGLRAGLGHRHRARSRLPAQAQEVHAFIRKRLAVVPRRAGGATRSASSTAAASSPTTSAP